LLSASAVGYYGDRGDEILSENTPPPPPGRDFLADVCRAWEAEATRAEKEPPGARAVRLRIGVVLGPGKDGPLHKMLYPVPGAPYLSPWKLGLGGPIGGGRQWLPWVHRDDVIGLIRWAMTRSDVASGPLNVVAPNPVTSRDLAGAIGRALGCPAVLPVPALAVRLLAGGVADAVLASQRVIPERAQALGYRFRFSTIEAALADLLPGAFA
jgi:hypothetical protein